jgi:HlyD family secretion protein
MKKWIVIALAAVVVVVAVVLALRSGGAGSDAERYEFVEVTRGDLENIITSTGTLSAVGTVEVGTQVSGTVSHVLVDYNESVTAGQVLAVLDTTMLSASVRDARASVMRTKALSEQADRELVRAYELFNDKLISDAEFEDIGTNAKSAEASLLSAAASLDRTVANLSYAVIRSPIDGTVIMRSVEPGQTVAASFSTPTLFIIAEDLSEMEIRALVDESDIGQIIEGQSVHFTVEAYIDEEFNGTVRQVWLQPQTVQNVVNYTVVIDAANEEGLLYPGMTATVDFMIDEVRDVLLVPNAALRFQPSESMIEEFRSAMQERMKDMPDSERQKMGAGRGGGSDVAGADEHGSPGNGQGTGSGAGLGSGSGMGGGNAFGDAARLWYLDEEGKLNVARVRTGATDGRVTEIMDGRGITEGTNAITKVNEEDSSRSSNPLSSAMRRRR